MEYCLIAGAMYIPDGGSYFHFWNALEGAGADKNKQVAWHPVQANFGVLRRHAKWRNTADLNP